MFGHSTTLCMKELKVPFQLKTTGIILNCYKIVNFINLTDDISWKSFAIMVSSQNIVSKKQAIVETKLIVSYISVNI